MKLNLRCRLIIRKKDKNRHFYLATPSNLSLGNIEWREIINVTPYSCKSHLPQIWDQLFNRNLGDLTLLVELIAFAEMLLSYNRFFEI